MTDTMSITNARLLELKAGFEDILSRPFPTATARQRASFQYASLKPALESYTDALKPLQEREAKAAEMEGAERRAEMQAIQRELTDLLQAEVDIPKPRKLLVDADLPRAKDGDANGIAVVRLAPEFFTLTDPDAE